MFFCGGGGEIYNPKYQIVKDEQETLYMNNLPYICTLIPYHKKANQNIQKLFFQHHHL